MSNHWPFIGAAYAVFFICFVVDWFVSVWAMRGLKQKLIMQRRRESGAQRGEEHE
jgi:heme exporter protein D